MYDISTLGNTEVSSERISLYLSSRLDQMAAIASDRVSSSPCELMIALRSCPPEANRQVCNLPSADRRARTQSPQNGSLTEEMNPISPEPSE